VVSSNGIGNLELVNVMWKLIFETEKIHQAEIVRSRLEEEGISAVVIDKRDSMYLFGTCKVMVREEDMDLAKTIIKNEIDF